jgi:hypothetical protein
LKYPAHSTGLTPGDYHLFPALKQNLGGLRFKDDHEVETIVTQWLITEDTGDMNREHKKIVPEYDVKGNMRKRV